MRVKTQLALAPVMLLILYAVNIISLLGPWEEVLRQLMLPFMKEVARAI